MWDNGLGGEILPWGMRVWDNGLGGEILPWGMRVWDEGVGYRVSGYLSIFEGCFHLYKLNQTTI